MNYRTFLLQHPNRKPGARLFTYGAQLVNAAFFRSFVSTDIIQELHFSRSETSRAVTFCACKPGSSFDWKTDYIEFFRGQGHRMCVDAPGRL